MAASSDNILVYQVQHKIPLEIQKMATPDAVEAMEFLASVNFNYEAV
ncbi:hypothetical protein [Novosphingobium terrae]|nr:hypothetical protein [Novosphingobium terrae]